MFPINIYFCRFVPCMFMVYWKCTERVQWLLYLLLKFQWRTLMGGKGEEELKSYFRSV